MCALLPGINCHTARSLSYTTSRAGIPEFGGNEGKEGPPMKRRPKISWLNVAATGSSAFQYCRVKRQSMAIWRGCEAWRYPLAGVGARHQPPIDILAPGVDHVIKA